jgi:Flp pilus assembly protein TadD
VAEAAPCFALALELNADNLFARVNSQCNSNLLARQPLAVDRSPDALEQFGRAPNWDQLLTANGPPDDPTFCYHLGVDLAASGMLRQAGLQFDRIKALVPTDVSARLALGEIYNTAGVAGKTLDLVAQIRADPNLRPFGLTNETDIAMLEAKAWFVLNERPKAQAIIYAVVATHPGNAFVLGRALVTFSQYQCYADALRLVERQLQLDPNDPAILANQGGLLISTGHISNAIPPLTLSLSLTNTYNARLYRAIAYLRTGKLEAAEADYQVLLQAFPASPSSCLQMASAAVNRGDTNSAIQYCKEYLARFGDDPRVTRQVAARLESLQPTRR